MAKKKKAKKVDNKKIVKELEAKIWEIDGALDLLKSKKTEFPLCQQFPRALKDVIMSEHNKEVLRKPFEGALGILFKDQVKAQEYEEELYKGFIEPILEKNSESTDIYNEIKDLLTIDLEDLLDKMEKEDRNKYEELVDDIKTAVIYKHKAPAYSGGFYDYYGNSYGLGGGKRKSYNSEDDSYSPKTYKYDPVTGKQIEYDPKTGQKIENQPRMGYSKVNNPKPGYKVEDNYRVEDPYDIGGDDPREEEVYSKSGFKALPREDWNYAGGQEGPEDLPEDGDDFV